MNVSVYGTGYVGLVTGVCLAELGHNVICLDIDEHKVSQLSSGNSPIYEANLDDMLNKNLSANRIAFTSDFSLAVTHGKIQLVCVGTPSLENGDADLSSVLNVTQSITFEMNRDTTIVIKSTVPVGTASLIEKNINKTIKQLKKINNISVISNPEFLREGIACHDCLQPDRIIIGSNQIEDTLPLKALYEPYSRMGIPIIDMSRESAELTKYASNAMLATKISFINQVSLIAEKVGANIEEISYGMGLDKRIGPDFLNAGCGYGGSCFPKDVKALTHTAKQLSVPFDLLTAVDNINHKQQRKLFELISESFKGKLKNKTFAIWGLAFKPDTDDLRDASSIILINELLSRGAIIQVFDPRAMENAKLLYAHHPNIHFKNKIEDTLINCDALAILTEWTLFKHYPLSDLKARMEEKPVFDGRNIYSLSDVARRKLNYISIGRPRINNEQSELA